MVWSGWYLLLSIFPLTILILFMKDGLRFLQGAMRPSWRRRLRPRKLGSLRTAHLSRRR